MLTIRKKYKEGRFSYSKYKVYIDDKMVGIIKDNEPFNKILDPGSYTVYLKTGLYRTRKIKFEVKDEKYKLFLIYEDPKLLSLIVFIIFAIGIIFGNNLRYYFMFIFPILFFLDSYSRTKNSLHKIS